LVSNKYTNPKKLAINGGSNGGLLVGACVNQVFFFKNRNNNLLVVICLTLLLLKAPELFGAAVADVGVLDMLRFHKFTIGHAWRDDYGDPDKKEDFEYIYKYN